MSSPRNAKQQQLPQPSTVLAVVGRHVDDGHAIAIRNEPHAPFFAFHAATAIGLSLDTVSQETQSRYELIARMTFIFCLNINKTSRMSIRTRFVYESLYYTPVYILFSLDRTGDVFIS